MKCCGNVPLFFRIWLSDMVGENLLYELFLDTKKQINTDEVFVCKLDILQSIREMMRDANV